MKEHSVLTEMQKEMSELLIKQNEIYRERSVIESHMKLVDRELNENTFILKKLETDIHILILELDKFVDEKFI